MNPAQIGAYAYQAGVTSQSGLQAAIAIALAESSGNPNATGDVALQNATWGPSLGLWQIRSVKAETGKGTVRDANQLKNPAFNAKSMYSISGGGKNWSPWSTWPLRAAAFMPVAAPAAASVIALKGVVGGVEAAGGAITDAAASVVPDGLADVGTGVRATYGWVSDRNNWVRVAKVGIGSVLVVGGIYAIAGSTDTGRAIIKGTAKAATVVATKGKAS
jgi:hypothetical protein